MYRTPLLDLVLNHPLVSVTDFINRIINLLDIYSCYLRKKSELVMIVKKESNGSVRQLAYSISGSQGDNLQTILINSEFLKFL